MLCYTWLYKKSKVQKKKKAYKRFSRAQLEQSWNTTKAVAKSSLWSFVDFSGPVGRFSTLIPRAFTFFARGYIESVPNWRLLPSRKFVLGRFLRKSTITILRHCDLPAWEKYATYSNCVRWQAASSTPNFFDSFIWMCQTCVSRMHSQDWLYSTYSHAQMYTACSTVLFITDSRGMFLQQILRSFRHINQNDFLCLLIKH